MGQCFSHFYSKHYPSNEEEPPRSVPTDREHLIDITTVTPEFAQAEVGKQLDTDNVNNSPLPTLQQPIDNDDIKDDLLKELELRECGEEGKTVILPDDVRQIWARNHYRKFYMSQVWYKPAWDRTDLMDQLVQIMSILISINFGEWEHFGAIFVDRSDRRDGDLPFDLDELQEPGFLGKSVGRSFHKTQFIFCPVPISQQEDEFILDQKRRLPWIDNPKLIGEGAFGKVAKRTVAKGFLHYQNRTVNSQAKAVAVKTLSDKDARKDEFKNELNNLKELRECLSDHENIMVNLVTMVDRSSQGDLYHIVYELAAYDLNVFLTNMPRNLRNKRHATVGPERTGSEHMWPGDLISESVNLADALDYLHTRLYTKSHTSLKSHVSLSHNDIKPENILVVYPDTTNDRERFPVGKWKFADFGLSVVKVKRSSGSHRKHLSAENATLSPSHPQKTHRTERPSSVSKAMPARDPGQYTAPELDQTTPQPEDCRKADVWSFGCVLAEIVTYAVKLDCHLVEDFRDSLGKSEQLGQRDPPNQRFYDHESKDAKPQFLTHLNKLPGTADGDKRFPENTHWILSCTNLIKKIVVKDPKVRFEASKIRAKLSEIDLSMRDEKNEWLNGLTVDTKNSDAVSGQTSAVSQSPTEIGSFDNAGDEALTRLPSFCFHPAEQSMPEIPRPRHGGEDERRRATAPR